MKNVFYLAKNINIFLIFFKKNTSDSSNTHDSFYKNTSGTSNTYDLLQKIHLLYEKFWIILICKLLVVV